MLRYPGKPINENYLSYMEWGLDPLEGDALETLYTTERHDAEDNGLDLPGE